jgi:uncharacterized Ntn-hydrolase superfamily protein
LGTTILGIEFNGGFRKGLIGTAITLITGLGGYVLHQSAKVDPLVVKTEHIEKKLDDHRETVTERWEDQKAWNAAFFSAQNRINDKLDVLIQASNRRPNP